MRLAHQGGQIIGAKGIWPVKFSTLNDCSLRQLCGQNGQVQMKMGEGVANLSNLRPLTLRRSFEVR
ncbi:MAG: hypothetical protein WCO04_07260, partial [Pseudomonadota bacterium]